MAPAPEGHEDGKTKTSPSAADETLLASVAEIPGIDADAAISRLLGRRDLYARLIRRVVDEGPDRLTTLETARHNADRRAMIETIHTAKSILGTLGADALQQRCVDLQRRFDEGTETDAELAGFMGELNALLRHLHDTAEPQNRG
jgi:HPt (histidine-containing phosphotransfer) domain-containing protein